MDEKKMVELAADAKCNAYAPYSGFRVGAAVMTGSGKVYTGANIENASYGATNCAERTAIFKAVSEGEREIKAIALVSDSKDYVYPCGICRQVMAEFGGSDTKIICGKSNGDFRVYALDDLLPAAFRIIEKDDERKV